MSGFGWTFGGCSPATGSSVSLLDVEFEDINLTDGTWTLNDPDNLVKSITASGSFNIVTWNALGVASSNYNWAAGTDHRAPRWYKLLKIEGTQIDHIDKLVMNCYIENDVTVNDFDQALVLGVAIDPTSTVAATIDGTGGYCKKNVGSSNVSYGVWTVNGSTTVSNANNAYAITSLFRGNNSLGGGTTMAYDSSNTVRGSTARGSNQNSATGSSPENLYIMVGIGTAASTDTITEDDQQKFRIRFNAITLSIT